ncbi:helix-turn-helix domain-containing protein [Succinivibrio sp.]|uniref:helix-turn-helix domain-containing protein n=1 Tax=Succinivibrio sp. TaxID=2053619 RepID=UPI0025EED390|nr:helix-turn-helix transcriptional regulator [Succinivibrio sp.]
MTSKLFFNYSTLYYPFSTTLKFLSSNFFLFARRPRKEKNLTKKQLSELTGITQADLSKIKNGNANPSLNTLLKLAKGLGKKLQFSLV